MKSEVRNQKKRGRGKFKFTLLCVLLLPLLQKELPVLSSPPTNYPKTANCQEQNVETLTAELLRDLPSYTNRISQRVRRRTTNVYSYVLTAGRPEFAPLTLGPGVYSPTDSQPPQQVFLTTLERQYTDGKAVELQQYHWLFLTQSSSGWRLAMMFSRIGTYPSGRPPTPPRDSSEGIIAQAIRTWLRDCQVRRN